MHQKVGYTVLMVLVLAGLVAGILYAISIQTSTNILSSANESMFEPPGPPSEQELATATQSASSVKEFSITAKRSEFIPATIRVKEGDTVRLHITSIDVTHGFSLPEFKIAAELTPGTERTLEFVASKKGTYSFFCTVVCGPKHGDMRGSLIVE